MRLGTFTRSRFEFNQSTNSPSPRRFASEISANNYKEVEEAEPLDMGSQASAWEPVKRI